MFISTSSSGTTSERLRIDSSGKIGIGSTSPGGFKLRVEGGDSDEGLHIHTGNSSSQWLIRAEDNAGTQRFVVKADGEVVIGDGNLVIGTAGKGIDFSANSHASGMSSETFHSYEEGSWTPAYENATSYATQVGHYTKIGRMVYAYFSINPYATSGSHAFINNLPFVAANQSGGGGGVAKGYQNYDTENGPIYYIEPNSTRIYFYKDNGTNFSAANGNGFNFRGVAVYHV